MKTLVCTIILSVLPALAIAEGCNRDTHTTSTCEAGQVWDDGIQACVDAVSS